MSALQIVLCEPRTLVFLLGKNLRRSMTTSQVPKVSMLEGGELLGAFFPVRRVLPSMRGTFFEKDPFFCRR